MLELESLLGVLNKKNVEELTLDLFALKVNETMIKKIS